MARAVFFIHIADATFSDPPCPGERRLGPFLTVEEAQAQAANDVAHGHVAPDALLGVYSDAESRARAEAMDRAHARHKPQDDPWEGPTRFDPRGRRGGKLACSTARILKTADKQRAEMLEAHARTIEDQRASLQQMLPEGVDADELLRIARGQLR